MPTMCRGWRLSRRRSTTAESSSSQHGDDPEVRAILRRLREQPNDILFTDPTTIGDLAEAVGDDISLSQQDLEICLQMRDAGVSDKDEHKDEQSRRASRT